jgi:hypothetical protein
MERDAAGRGPHIPQGVRLYRLHELEDWEVADGEPDVRGWEVRTISDRLLGKVKDLLVDPSRNEVVLLDVDLEDSSRHTLAPVRAAQIDRDAKVVRLDSADLETEAVPSLAREAWTDQEVRDFDAGYAKAYGDRGWEDDRDLVIGGTDRDLRFARHRPVDADPPVETRSRDREVRIEAVSDEGRSINEKLGGLRNVRYRDRDVRR